MESRYNGRYGARIQVAYGEKYDSVMMFNSKRDVTALLYDEDKFRAYGQKSSQKNSRNMAVNKRKNTATLSRNDNFAPAHIGRLKIETPGK